MMKNRRGFIAISVIYSFFIIFLMLMLIILNAYFNNRTSFDIYKDNIKAKAAIGYTYHDTTLLLTQAVINQAALTKSLNAGVSGEINSPNYRYFGVSPNNYVCFGKLGNSCNDEKYLFRIVGVFKESTFAKNGGSGYITKIVRATPLSDLMRYHSNSTNLWSSSDLKNYLNGNYINTDAQFESLFKDMIIEAKWYAPAHNTVALTAALAYTNEMGATGSRVSNGKIGLLSISDWGFASKTFASKIEGACLVGHTMNQYNADLDHTCHLYNWLNSDQWFIDNFQTSSYAMTLTTKTSTTRENNLVNLSVTSKRHIFPTFYLDSRVVVMSGSGTKVDPYIINLLGE